MAGRSGNRAHGEAVAVATHRHADYSNLLSANQHSPCNGGGNPQQTADTYRDSPVSESSPSPQPPGRGQARPTRTKREREAYDPELEKLVRERVQELNVQVDHEANSVGPATTNGVGRDDCSGPPPPCPRVRGLESAPAVPPRRTGAMATVAPQTPSSGIGCSDTLHHQVISSTGLGALPGGQVSQQAVAGVVNDGEHDYINQDHLDSILEEQENEVKYIPQSSASKGDQNDDVILLRQASVRSTVSTTSSLFNIEPVKSSSGHKSEGPESRASVVGVKNMGEFEKRLLLAKQKGRAPMPSVMHVPWYHPGITRHIAECLLLSRDIKDGTYLLRQAGDALALSVRCQSSTRHYRIVWDGKQFTFGLGKFPTVDVLQAHFDSKPIISGQSGVLVQLSYPYPRAVSEPAMYEDANVVTTGLTDEEVEQLKERLDPKSHPASSKKRVTSSSVTSEVASSTASSAPSESMSVSAQLQPYLSINSMEGYLTKLGFHRKNWKRRWFLLYRNELKYYNNKDDKEPIKTINLEDATSVTRDDSCGKSHCFRLVTTYRTFYMYAVSDTQANEWVQMLQWKLSTLNKQSTPRE